MSNNYETEFFYSRLSTNKVSFEQNIAECDWFVHVGLCEKPDWERGFYDII